MSGRWGGRVRLKVVGSFLVAATLAGCGKTPESPPPAATAPGPGRLALAEASRQYLTIAEVGPQGEAAGVVLPGRVAFRPQGMSAVGAPLAGRIVSVDVRPGEIVKAGAALATLQSAEAAAVRSAFLQAQAKAAAADDMVRRQNEMIVKGVGLDVERFAAQTAQKEAAAELDRARRTLAQIGMGPDDRVTVRAPAAGVVLSVRASVGATVVPGGEALVEVGDPGNLWVIADVPESDIAGLAPGQQAEIRIPSAGRSFPAVVDGTGQRVDGEQRRLPLYLAPRGSTGGLTPGMLAEVRLRGGGPGQLHLPVTAVLIKDGGRRVVYVETAGGGFEARPVRTGVSRDGRVAILEGLDPGSRVVVRGALLLDGEAEQLL